MESLLQDIRYGVRSLLKSPQFAVAAVLTLALGIGANTAMFSVIHSVLLKPLPFHDPERVMVVGQRMANGGVNVFSTPDFLDWKQQGGMLAQMAAFVPGQFNLSRGNDQPERISGAQLSYEAFPVLGVTPIVGRTFSAQEDIAGAGHVTVLSYALWQTRFEANPHILGSAIRIDDAPYTVVGVMPAGFHLFSGEELLWTPLQLQRGEGVNSARNVHWLQGLIRLPSGTTLARAQAELNTVAARLHREHPADDAGFGVQLQTFSEAQTGEVRPALLMLMGCVGMVLLIACSNVANLLLARGAMRRREVAVRVALGASAMRVVRQFLTESVILAIVSGGLGVALAVPVLRLLLAIHPANLPRIQEVAIDGNVLAYTLLISVAAGVLFGLAPALEAAHADVGEGLRERLTGAGRSFGRYRSALIVAETALASILLIGAGLALKSLGSLARVPSGFNPDHVLSFRVAAPPQFSGERAPEFYREIEEKMRALPGVESASVARNLPMSGSDPSMPVTAEGQNVALAAGQVVTRLRAVGADYFRTLEIPVLRGRAFDEHDTAASPPAVIVSESLARIYWPNENPVGRRLKPNLSGAPWYNIVGVAADVRHWGPDVDIEPTAYYPYTQIPASVLPLVESDMSLAVRSRMDEEALLSEIRPAVAGVDKSVPVYSVKTMNEMLSDTGSLRRFDLSLLGAFAGLALVLAAIGVYAVMAYSVSQRTREIGIRIALGARAGDVAYLILSQGARLALAGVTVGVLAALLLRRVAASFLYGLSAADPLAFTLVPLLIVLVILLACWLPARRAARVDPMVALRYE